MALNDATIFIGRGFGVLSGKFDSDLGSFGLNLSPMAYKQSMIYFFLLQT